MNKQEKSNELYPVLGSVYSPNKTDKWVVIAVDIYNRIFLETSAGSIYFYTLEEFNRSFSVIN